MTSTPIAAMLLTAAVASGLKRCVPLLALVLWALARSASARPQEIRIINSGFEEGATGWEFISGHDDCGITDSQAATGRHALQIISPPGRDVRVQSERIRCKGPGLVELHGQFLARWGYYLNLRLEQLDATGAVLADAPPFTLGPFGMNGVWEPLVGFRGVGPVELHKETTHVRMVLEGKAGEDRLMEVYFDDFQIFDLSGATASSDPGSMAATVLEATGRRTRVVWTRGCRDAGGVLMGFDTTEGKERVIVDDPLPCHNPWITRDGKRIFFTGPDQTAYVVDWNGENLRPILTGRHYYILGYWGDPASGVEWVYVGDNSAPETLAELKASGSSASTDSALSVYRYSALSVYRYPDARHDRRERVWNKSPVNRRVNIGPDGRLLAGELPWPNCGLAALPDGNWTFYGEGCNPNIAPDGSGRFFLMTGDHRHIRMFGPEGPRDGGNRIAVNTMPGNLKDPRRAVWRPRWSNNVRFFTINSSDLGPSADAYIGEFNADFTGIARWIRITDSVEYDADSIAWIEP